MRRWYINKYNQITETRIALRTELCSHILVVLTLAAAAVLVVGAGVGAAATTWYVDDDGGAADYDNIQDAVNAASDGDMIFVHSGIYNETAIVDRSLTLQGENREATIIDANGEGLR